VGAVSWKALRKSSVTACYPLLYQQLPKPVVTTKPVDAHRRAGENSARASQNAQVLKQGRFGTRAKTRLTTLFQVHTAPLKTKLSTASSQQPQQVLYRATLQSGDAGTAQTIEKIRELLNDAWGDPNVAAYAGSLLYNWDVAQHDPMAEARAVWLDAKTFHFANDPFTKEVLHPVWQLLNTRVGDCDDINALVIPGLLGAMGIESRLVTIAADPRDPTAFSHIYAEANVNGQWVPLDAARPRAQFGLAPERWYRREWWSVTSSEHQNYPGPGQIAPLSGMGCCGQRGMGRGMGQISPLAISEIGSGITSLASGVVTAVNGQPVLSAVANPIGPGGYAISAAPSVVASAPVSTPPSGMLLLVLGALALFAFAK
jgi:hypothetical protein